MSLDSPQRTAEEIQQDLQRELSNILMPPSSPTPDSAKIDLKRFRKVRWFFIRTFIHVIWWDLLLNRPFLRWLRTPPLPRWQKIARRYRALAVEMGGVLIKLGQFLSIRVDVLPVEVTSELAGLQDEVPPERLEDVVARVEADFGRPLSEIFEWFSPEPLGAASLAQVHLARIASGEEVVVKVLRPGIEVLVETDLAAITLAFRWLKYYGPIRRRIDTDSLAREFDALSRGELDFEAEGRHAEQFGRNFADEKKAYLPQIYWEYSAAHTLTMENVGYIKIADSAALEAAGIQRAEVAKILHTIYMKQVFVDNFVHVDPHPGNLFVKPLPTADEIEAGITTFGPNDEIPYAEDRGFQLVFIDFGMVAIVPERMRDALREFAIGVGTRDAHKMVQAYVSAGVLLPGADIKRLEEAHEAIFDRFWGVQVGQMQDVAMREAQDLMREYYDVIYEAPFQFPADMLFIMRAIGILSGLATNLDEQFDPWSNTIPFAEQFAKEQLIGQGWQGGLDYLSGLGQYVIKWPSQVDRILTQTERGKLTIETSLAPDARKTAQRLEQAVNRLSTMVVAAAMLIAGVNLEGQNPDGRWGDILLGLAVITFLWGLLKR
ncbi:MAG: AarF/UbiB family protein [Chloroflexota bacterium]